MFAVLAGDLGYLALLNFKVLKCKIEKKSEILLSKSFMQNLADE